MVVVESAYESLYFAVEHRVQHRSTIGIVAQGTTYVNNKTVTRFFPFCYRLAQGTTSADGAHYSTGYNISQQQLGNKKLQSVTDT